MSMRSPEAIRPGRTRWIITVGRFGIQIPPSGESPQGPRRPFDRLTADGAVRSNLAIVLPLVLVFGIVLVLLLVLELELDGDDDGEEENEYEVDRDLDDKARIAASGVRQVGGTRR